VIELFYIEHKTTAAGSCFEVIDCVPACCSHCLSIALCSKLSTDRMVYMPDWLHDRKWDVIIVGHLALSALAALHCEALH